MYVQSHYLHLHIVSPANDVCTTEGPSPQLTTLLASLQRACVAHIHGEMEELRRMKLVLCLSREEAMEHEDGRIRWAQQLVVNMTMSSLWYTPLCQLCSLIRRKCEVVVCDLRVSRHMLLH